MNVETEATLGSARDAALDVRLGRAVDEILSRHAAVGFAACVVRAGGAGSFTARGFADLASRRPAGPDTVFRIASITKTFTAIAVMQLQERGLVDLDAAADSYLRAYRLIPTGTSARPATVRHLLTHTAGVPEVVHPSGVVRRLFGETVAVGAPMPSLADYYHGGLRTVAEPGTRFAYSDHNFTTLGQIIEDVTGELLDHYLREHVFAPLGMESTALLRSSRLAPRLAVGYTLGRHGPRPVADFDLITAAAGGAYSTPADMARYAAALLGGGANSSGRMLAPDSLATMFDPHYRPDPRLPGIGLAFWRSDGRGHRVLDHGGILPGFNSEMFLAPDDGVAVLTFTNGARRAMFWLPAETGRILDALIGVPELEACSGAPQRPEVWSELCGWYALPARFSDVRAREMVGLGVEVFVRGGQLMLRILTPVPVLYRGFPLQPDSSGDPYAFRLDLSRFDIGTARVVFSRATGGVVSGIHFDLLPMSAYKRRNATNPRRWLQAAGVLTVGLAASRWLRRQVRGEHQMIPARPR